MSTPAVQAFCDSVAFTAGIGHERRRMTERLLQRAADLRDLPGPTSRSVQAELRRLADELEAMP
jgi:hypothetical protein